jgi:outer membrane protein assembly factor BamB
MVWRKDFRQEHKQTTPDFGAAMSPLFENGLVIAHVGGNGDGELSAFDAKTGAVRWRWTEDGPAYSSPVVAMIGGVRQVVTQTQTRCVGLDPANGRLLWSLPFKTPYDQNSVTPVVAGSDTVVFAGLQQPTFAVKVAKSGGSWVATKAWETRDAQMYMSTPVLSSGRLYGLSARRQGQMFSLEAATGKVLWTGEGRQGENASVWDVGPAVLALTTGADLIVFRKGADGSLTESARYPVADGAVWASPAFVGRNRLLVKDADSVALWEFPAATAKR